MITDEFYSHISGYVESHLTERITVKEMADTVHLQPGYFIQRFRKSFHTTPVRYVNQMRLENTVRHLTGEPGEGLEEIAWEAGFRDYRHFSRLFKRRYGMTPSAYRRKLQEESPAGELLQHESSLRIQKPPYGGRMRG